MWACIWVGMSKGENVCGAPLGKFRKELSILFSLFRRQLKYYHRDP